MVKKITKPEKLDIFEEGLTFSPPKKDISINQEKGIAYLHYDIQFPEGSHALDITNYYPTFFQSQNWNLLKIADFKNLLRDVLAVKDGNKVDVVNFIENWGPLWACEHVYYVWDPVWSPLVLPSDPNWVVEDYERKIPFKDRLLSWNGVEELDRYYRVFRRASAVLESARILEQGKAVPPETLARVTYMNNLEEFEKTYDPTSLESQQANLVETVNDYLEINVGQKLQVGLDRNLASHRLKYDPGFGILWSLWLIIMNVISRTSDIFMCDYCGRVYRRDSSRRKPKPGQSNYCESCADNKAAWKTFEKKRRTEKENS